jgi:hypothetical protein
LAASSWGDFESAAAELAAFGRERFAETDVAYLATVDADGAPRVHPVTPIIGGGHLFVFMEPTSPKGKDLQRGSRYALHCGVGGPDGGGGEFFIRGSAMLVSDPETRAVAVKSSSYNPQERYILFELGVDEASSTVYEGGKPKRKRWRAG